MVHTKCNEISGNISNLAPNQSGLFHYSGTYTIDRQNKKLLLTYE